MNRSNSYLVFYDSGRRIERAERTSRGKNFNARKVPGKVVYTPGHTYGSISVILDSGEVFVGCLAHNRLPFVLRPKLPIYAMDLELLKESWLKVINMGAKTIYPGHGKPFPVEKITKYLN